MRDLTRDNFGLLIAYLLPGFVALVGTSYHVEAVRPWLQATPADAPTVGGFLYATLASTALGLVISGVRWATVDRILGRLGVRPPRWDFEMFAERLAAYQVLVAIHYRYYQFYANMLVALAYAYLARLAAAAAWDRSERLLLVGFLLIEGVLFAGSWDTLGKYYARTGALLAPAPSGARGGPEARRGRGTSRGVRGLRPPSRPARSPRRRGR